MYTRKHHSFVCSFVCMWDIEFEGEGKPELDLENDEGGHRPCLGPVGVADTPF